MFDPVDSGRQGVLHAEQRVGVRHDGKADTVRLVDHRREFGARELCAQWVAVRRCEPARSHHLDHVDAALGALSDGHAQVALHRSA